MLRSAAWGLAALAVAAPAFAADPPADKPPEKSWLGRLVGGTDPKPAGPPTFADTPARPPTPVGPLDPTVLADALKDEQAAWVRRLDVCLRLRELAAETNDEALSQQAEELERRATELYHARTARLGVKGPRGSASSRTTRPAPAADPLPESPAPAASTPTRFKEVARD